MRAVRRLILITLLGFGLAVSGCGNATPQHNSYSQNAAQIAKAVKAANSSIAKMAGATTTKVSSAKEIVNPYLSDVKLRWPRMIIVVTYSGTFKAPVACTSGQPSCLPITFTSATVVINPLTDAVLETVEPAWTTRPTPKVTPKPSATATPKTTISPKAGPSASPTK
jgi:hypothetical protein